MREMRTDILIVGGGTGGVAAALAAARNGANVIIVEPTDWLGGQLTSQGVPPDENQWVESFGASASYADLRTRVRAWYRAHGNLVPAAAADPLLNPGGGWVSRLCASPHIWHAAIVDMLAPHIAAGRITVLFNCEPIDAELAGDHVRSVTFATAEGAHATVHADIMLDATETGDLLALAHIEHAIGAEHRDVYGELHGRPDRSDPLDQQAISWCFALENRPDEDHRIRRPDRYDFWRAFVPTMSDGSQWTGPLFSWTVPSHNAAGHRTFRMIPWPAEPDAGELEMWRYRRIAAAALHVAQPSGPNNPSTPDVSLINMVQMDYWQRPLLGVSTADRHLALAEARELSACFLYWIQSDAPHHNGTSTGYPGLRLRGHELGTSDGFAKHAYIREPRRLLARTVLTEQHLGTDQRAVAGHTRDANWTSVPNNLGTGEPFPDSIAIGHYTIDLHPSCAGRGSVYVPCAPFRVPMGSLIPRRVQNVLAAGKCLGVSHVANGATRMHTTEWHVGEGAGTLAAWCITNRREPHAVLDSAGAVAGVQDALARDGGRIAWPWEL